MCLGVDRDRSGAIGPFPCGLEVVGCVLSILVHLVGRGLRSVSFPCTLGALECFRPIRVRPGRRLIRSGAFGPFLCALGVVGIIRVRSVHSLAHWGSSCSFWCVRSIPAKFRCRSVRSGAFAPFPRVVVVVGFSAVAFCPFPCAVGLVVLVRVRSVHFCAPWGSSGSFGSIPARHGCRRVRSDALAPVIRALGVVGFLWVRLVHSRAPLRW